MTKVTLKRKKSLLNTEELSIRDKGIIVNNLGRFPTWILDTYLRYESGNTFEASRDIHFDIRAFNTESDQSMHGWWPLGLIEEVQDA